MVSLSRALEAVHVEGEPKGVSWQPKPLIRSVVDEAQSAPPRPAAARAGPPERGVGLRLAGAGAAVVRGAHMSRPLGDLVQEGK